MVITPEQKIKLPACTVCRMVRTYSKSYEDGEAEERIATILPRERV